MGIGLIALTVVAWDGLGIDGERCSSLARPSDLRSSEEYVLGACLVAAVLALALAGVAGRSRRAVTELVIVAFVATVVAAAYFASHAYSASCLSQD